jgi:hypothetical protein
LTKPRLASRGILDPAVAVHNIDAAIPAFRQRRRAVGSAIPSASALVAIVRVSRRLRWHSRCGFFLMVGSRAAGAGWP